eukprot:CAMPEP_0167782672 /NCGR_PEP_ID=MMETSP0111_2-20121227/6648_1 /TAXON_ID=91324 /ORGANISM="Lotharella globosa, Strain CCCM811" /LENGTH=31 /DNA_ID= /DNA_START= /DNA_END= /DNA_ORIENTATION=
MSTMIWLVYAGNGRDGGRIGGNDFAFNSLAV